MEIKKIVEHFNLQGKIIDIFQKNSGNINKTYIVTTQDKEKQRKYTLQKINTTVFNEPYLLMQNIENITKYYRNYLRINNLDEERGTLSVIKTKNNMNLFCTNDKEYYRMYNYIDNSVSYNTLENADMFYNVGVAFGGFVKVLNDYPMDKLHETIPNFHNSKVRFQDFLSAIKKDPCNRVKNVASEIVYLIQRSDEFSLIVDAIKSDEIPVRVTHNDTKLNNVLFDKDTNEVLAVIDLDTVMPGSALYDFGDAIRAGAATAFEDELDLNKVTINMDYFKSFTKAYLAETKDILTPKEIEYLPLSCKIITLELAMRFLNDYINGDTYFKCDYENHNLDRARNQLKLANEIELKQEEMKSIVKKYTKNKNLSLKNKV